MSVPESIEPVGVCTCGHPPDCRHGCHDHRCDPGEEICSIEFRPDEGGLTWVGCDTCTPGVGAPHLGECPILVPIATDPARGDTGDAIRL